MRVLAALVAMAAAAEPPLPEPDYVSLAKAAYRAGMADRLNCHPPRGTRAPGCCRGGCAPDSWALGAALLWREERDPYFKAQAQEQLTNFTLRWLNTTNNGSNPLLYQRSGFFGWMLPLAYAELDAANALPPWDEAFTTSFKRACHSFMAPTVVSRDGKRGDVPGCDPTSPHPAATYGCEGGDGYWEMGNWNKGFVRW